MLPQTIRLEPDKDFEGSADAIPVLENVSQMLSIPRVALQLSYLFSASPVPVTTICTTKNLFSRGVTAYEYN